MDERLPLTSIDLDTLATALDDHGGWASWFLDPATGSLVLSTDEGAIDDGYTEDDLDDLIAVDPLPARHAYDTMVEFTDAVPDPRVRAELLRAIEGKGAFRRFRRTLDDWPELGLLWRDVDQFASELRALAWLRDHDVVRADEVGAAIVDHRRRIDGLLETFADTGPVSFDAREVPNRWDEIARHVEHGGVVLTRDGDDWCTITPILPID